MRFFDAGRDVRTIGLLLSGAEAEARLAGQSQPGPEHLVLAATALPDGTAARACAAVGVDDDALRDALESAHRDALGAVGVVADADIAISPALRGPARGALRSTPQAQQVFQRAVAMSKRRRQGPLRGADVVAAACELQRGTLVRALDALGVDRKALAAAAEAAVR